jgi:hypothetical protein
MSEWKQGDKVWIADANGERARECEIRQVGDDQRFLIGIGSVRLYLDLDDLHETEQDALAECCNLLDERIRQHALDAAQLVHVRSELMVRYEKIGMPF